MRLRRASIITTLAGTLVALPTAPALAQKAGQTFKSPLKNFTVPVPQLGLGGTVVQKKNTKNDGTVSFIGDTGDFHRIDYMRLPPRTPALTADEQQAGHERILKGLVEANANSAIVVQKPYTLDDIPMLLAVVSFPGGSHLMDQRTRKHFDSTRGLLFFVRGGFVYVLHDELIDIVFGMGKEPPSAEELTVRAERSLPKFYSSFTFQ